MISGNPTVASANHHAGSYAGIIRVGGSGQSPSAIQFSPPGRIIDAKANPKSTQAACPFSRWTEAQSPMRPAPARRIRGQAPATTDGTGDIILSSNHLVRSETDCWRQGGGTVNTTDFRQWRIPAAISVSGFRGRKLPRIAINQTVWCRYHVRSHRSIRPAP